MCLKGEIKKFDRMSGHEHVNVIRMVGLVASEHGKCVGLLLPFLRGQKLLTVKRATDAQKRRWKEQLKSAVQFLHNIGVV